MNRIAEQYTWETGLCRASAADGWASNRRLASWIAVAGVYAKLISNVKAHILQRVIRGKLPIDGEWRASTAGESYDGWRTLDTDVIFEATRASILQAKAFVSMVF